MYSTTHRQWFIRRLWSTFKLSFSSNVNDTVVNFTCADLGTNPVQLWVTDASGNQDFVDVDIIIQDNLGVCGNTMQPRIAASLTTAGGMGVHRELL